MAVGITAVGKAVGITTVGIMTRPQGYYRSETGTACRSFLYVIWYSTLSCLPARTPYNIRITYVYVSSDVEVLYSCIYHIMYIIVRHCKSAENADQSMIDRMVRSCLRVCIYNYI
jgi:hypothetical protein